VAIAASFARGGTIRRGPTTLPPRALVKKSKCSTCHPWIRKKDGPAYKDVAAKYKGKPDAEQKLTCTHYPPTVKFDGKEEKHESPRRPTTGDQNVDRPDPLAEGRPATVPEIWGCSGRVSVAMESCGDGGPRRPHALRARPRHWRGRGACVTETLDFCTGCHEIRGQRLRRIQGNDPRREPAGVRAISSDCHVPKEPVALIKRKMQPRPSSSSATSAA
jgi:cytochrome c